MAALNPFQSHHGEDYFETNVQGTENILKSVLELKQKAQKIPDVFLASSVLVYQPEKIKVKILPKKTDKELIEEDCLKPFLEANQESVTADQKPDSSVSHRLLSKLKLDPSEIYYNDSKLLAESVDYSYAKASVSVKVARLPNCYGPGSKQSINQLIEEKQHGQALTLEGKDDLPRDYLYYQAKSPHDDVLRLIQNIAEKGKAGEAYNIASNGRFVRSLEEVKEAIENLQIAENLEQERQEAIAIEQKIHSPF